MVAYHKMLDDRLYGSPQHLPSISAYNPAPLDSKAALEP